MKKSRFLILMAVGLVLSLFAASGWSADLATMLLNKALGRKVFRYAATDGCMAMRVKHLGAIGSATIVVASDGNLEFVNRAGSADTNIVASTGIIDVSGSTVDTFGEVADVINASDEWRCVLVAVLPSQSINNKLTAVSVTAVGLSDPEGKPLYYNTADLDMVSIAIGPEDTVTAELTETDLLNRRSTATGSLAGKQQYQNELLYVTTEATYTTGAPDLLVYAVKSDSAGATELLLWQAVGAATTVAKTIPVLPTQAAIKAPPGWRLVVMYLDTSTADVTAGSMEVIGRSYRLTP